MKFEVSDWVQAKTRNGEFVQGFIESFDSTQGFAKVFVVQSDHAEVIGKTTTVLRHWLRKLPMSPLKETFAIHSLIDLALVTRDEQWFNELHETLSQTSKSGHLNKREATDFSSTVNRLGFPV